MGKSKKKSNQQAVGSLIIKDRFAKRNPHRSADSFLHTSELNDGYDWGRLNLQSVTEQNHLDDFLATAELAGTEFTAEKLNIQIINETTAPASVIPTDSELEKITAAQQQFKQLLRIPRRPSWHGGMSAEELQSLERQHFLEWRRSLAELQEKEHIVITPFERNLDFWRQLWRVIERSDIVVQIVDSRNPLLFRCEDLETYVKEVDNSKVNVLLVNKSDFLTYSQRQYWCEYFNKINVKILFWSAKLEAERQESQTMDDSSHRSETDTQKVDTESADDDNKLSTQSGNVDQPETIKQLNTPTLYTATELIDQLKLLAPTKLVQDGMLTVGLVGYPNVGKSSSINAILEAKKCSVSATPGKTKHFQTLYVDPTTILCDCPGLVMPSFATTKAEMILNGILPIDQMRDHKPAVNALAHKIPRVNLEAMYGIIIRKPKEGENAHRPPTDLELLNAYGAMRGFMTSSGVPDCPRSARVLLKDYVNGKLLYCEPPPDVSAEDFQCTPILSRSADGAVKPVSDKLETLKVTVDDSVSRKLDHEFFKKSTTGSHFNGKATAINSDGKFNKKHGNRHKKEKTRRLYAHLDKHDAY